MRATILEELKQLDQRLQGVHPSFAYALQETVSPVHAAPCLRLLRDVRARALAINLQVVWHFHLPEAARRLLPRRAGSLLPRPIAEALRGVTPGTPRAALDALAAKLMARLEVTQAAPADAAPPGPYRSAAGSVAMAEPIMESSAKLSAPRSPNSSRSRSFGFSIVPYL